MAIYKFERYLDGITEICRNDYFTYAETMGILAVSNFYKIQGSRAVHTAVKRTHQAEYQQDAFFNGVNLDGKRTGKSKTR